MAAALLVFSLGLGLGLGPAFALAFTPLRPPHHHLRRRPLLRRGNVEVATGTAALLAAHPSDAWTLELPGNATDGAELYYDRHDVEVHGRRLVAEDLEPVPMPMPLVDPPDSGAAAAVVREPLRGNARPHQIDAVRSICEHYRSGRGGASVGGRDGGGGDGDGDGDGIEDGAPDATTAGGTGGRGESRRATVVLPPGAGKTLVGLWAIEAVAPSGVCLVVLPSLMLIDQTLKEYKVYSQSVNSGRSPVMVRWEGVCGRMDIMHTGGRVLVDCLPFHPQPPPRQPFPSPPFAPLPPTHPPTHPSIHTPPGGGERRRRLCGEAHHGCSGDRGVPAR